MIVQIYRTFLLLKLSLVIASLCPRDVSGLGGQTPSLAGALEPFRIQKQKYGLLDSKDTTQSRSPSLLAEFAIAKENIEWFIEHLRSYSSDLQFDREEFDREQEFLNEQFLIISRFIRRSFPHSKPLNSMLTFANTTFLAFQHASDVVSGLCQGGTALSLVRYTVRLNIGLLRYFDNYGVPAPWYPGYAERLDEYTNALESWVEIFNGLDDVPPHVESIFRSKVLEAQNTLLFLEEYRWKSEITIPKKVKEPTRVSLPPFFGVVAAAWNMALAVGSLTSSRG